MSNNYKRYFLTSESVTEGHADKVCDYISDSILDACLEQDRESRVAVETFISRDKVVVAGQITSNAIIDIEKIVYLVIMRIIREWTQLSQKEFAKSINRSESGIQAFELGKRSYDVKTLLQIAQIHNIEITIEKKDK